MRQKQKTAAPVGTAAQGIEAVKDATGAFPGWRPHSKTFCRTDTQWRDALRAAALRLREEKEQGQADGRNKPFYSLIYHGRFAYLVFTHSNGAEECMAYTTRALEQWEAAMRDAERKIGRGKYT